MDSYMSEEGFQQINSKYWQFSFVLVMTLSEYRRYNIKV